MKKLIIDSKQKEDILRMHGFIKEQASGLGPDDIMPGLPGSGYNDDGSPKTETPSVTPTATDKKIIPTVEGKVFIDAIASGCLPGPKTKIKKTKKGTYVYVEKAKSGKIIYFYDNLTWKLSDGSGSGKWACPELTNTATTTPSVTQSTSTTTPSVTQSTSTTTSTTTLSPQGSSPVLPKTNLEKKLETMSAQELAQSAKDVNQTLSDDLSFNGCTQLVDTYFELAKKGQPNKDIETFKKKVYACNDNHRSSWKEDTKDKLRWLRGNEEEAKKIFGLFKKYPRTGNIRDTEGRKVYRLNQLPEVN
jgi:hypothetical protein